MASVPASVVARDNFRRGAMLAAGTALAVGASLTSGLAWAERESAVAVILPLAMVGGLGMGALALHRFEFFVGAILIIRPILDLVQADIGPAGLDPAGMVSIMFLIVAAIWLAMKRAEEEAVPLPSFVLPLIAFLGLVVFGIVFSVDRIASVTEALRIATVVMILLVLNRLLVNWRTIRFVLFAVLASAIVPIAVAAYQRYAGVGLTYESSLTFSEAFYRVRGTFTHPNPFALYLTLVLIIGVAVRPHLTFRGRLAVLALMASAIPVLFFTYTRTAWIAAFTGLLLVGLLQSKRLVMMLSLGIVIAAVSIPSFLGRFSDLTEQVRPTGGTGNSLAWRFQHWEAVLSLDRDPVFGSGLGTIQTLAPEEAASHNDFVRLYVETGVLGVAVYAWFLWTLIATAWRLVARTTLGLARGLAVAFAGSVAMVMIASLSSNLLRQLVILWYFAALALLAVASWRLARREGNAA